MAKADEQAFFKLKQLIDDNHRVSFDKKFGGYEITLYTESGTEANHYHINGDSLIEIIMKAK